MNLSVYRDIKPSPPTTAVSPLTGLPAKIVLQPGPAGLTYQMIPVQASQAAISPSQPVVMALQPLQTSARDGGPHGSLAQPHRARGGALARVARVAAE